MAGTVPATRPTADGGGMTFGAPVRSFDWQSAAALSNYVRGRGSVLVPMTLIAQSIAAGTVTRTYRFRVRTNQFCRRRLWLLQVLGTTATAPSTVSVVIAVNGSTTLTQSVPASNSIAEMIPNELYEPVTSPNQNEQELSLAVTTSATGAVVVYSIACIELPMAELDFTTDSGQDLVRVRPTAPIDVSSLGVTAYDGSNPTVGAINAGRRVGMHHYALGTESAGTTTTSTTNTTLYTASCGPPMLGRMLYTGDTKRALTAKVYGKVTGGATLTVTLTMVSGATLALTTTSAVAGWFGGTTINVDAEDLTASDGRRSTRWDLLKIEYKVSSAIQTGTIWSVSIWEDLAP